ncbi:MAG: hypothetical protein ACI83D_000199 [Planctomycetota bacterium]|jgi:hypothetical protein
MLHDPLSLFEKDTNTRHDHLDDSHVLSTTYT